MNTATRAIPATHNNLKPQQKQKWMMIQTNPPIIGLAIIILLSALILIYTKELNRELLVKYQSLQQQQEELVSKHSSLLLTKGKLSTPKYITHRAKKQLSMHAPSKKQVILLNGNTYALLQ